MHKQQFLAMAAGAVLSATLATAAQAALFETAFTFSDFDVGLCPGGTCPAVPQDPVGGLIVWEGASATSPIDAIVSISLTIAGKTYDLSEVVFENLPGERVIGGAAGGATTMPGGVDDFILSWDPDTGAPGILQYAVAAEDSYFISTTATAFSLTPASVGEPSLGGLLGLGLAGLALAARRRTRA